MEIRSQKSSIIPNPEASVAEKERKRKKTELLNLTTATELNDADLIRFEEGRQKFPLFLLWSFERQQGN